MKKLDGGIPRLPGAADSAPLGTFHAVVAGDNVSHGKGSGSATVKLPCSWLRRKMGSALLQVD